MSPSIARNSYGKSRVRMVKVRRIGGRHELSDVSIDIRLEGAFEPAFVDGDNSRVLPTDTMKNTVYALGKDHLVEPIEDFGALLCEHFLEAIPHATKASASIEENVWSRIEAGGQPHPHAFVSAGAERRVATVTATVGGELAIESGIDDLLVLKTTGSSFSGYSKDRFTTLKEVEDRIFSTLMAARWRTSSRDETPSRTWENARRALLETFAEQHSLSVQHALFALGRAVFAACPAIVELGLSLPNKHCLLVDLSPFGLTNDNEIFVPVDEPQGRIEATLKRGG